MSRGDLLGISTIPLEQVGGDSIELVHLQRPLRRVLAFARRTIDDVINDPCARNEVIGYYKLYRKINRTCEIVDLERQWNPNRITV